MEGPTVRGLAALVRGRRFWFVAALVLCLAGGLLGRHFATAFYLDEAGQRGANTLRLAVAALRGELSRYEPLPEILAGHPDVVRLVAEPDNSGQLQAMNRYLQRTNALLQSSEVYIMVRNGDTIAASNYDTEGSFVGDNFSYRPYFTEALAGGQGRFFALGTTSSKRGYYFGAPVRIEDGIGGVVVVKVDVDKIERTWRGGDYEIIVTDPEGIIFMSGRPGWRYRSLLPLTEDRLRRTTSTRRYAEADLSDLPARRSSAAGRDLLTISSGEGAGEYLVVSEQMAEADWTVSVLHDTRSAHLQADTIAVVVMLSLGLTVILATASLQRRTRLRERIRMQADARATLEHRVLERTMELAELNRRLESEVAERRTTEEVLRKTQSDLVQAEKLAALGRMSAALSHEFNQPLAAARNYTENATLLIDRGMVEEGRASISQVSRLIDRMASISRHLRNFARKPNQRIMDVSFHRVVEEALDVIGWQVEGSGVELRVLLGNDPLFVEGGPVRLQQVVVNLLSNALDALEGVERPFVEISATRGTDEVVIEVRDNGPGVPAGVVNRIFDPFFTTKGIGKGLGLGLSISYNIIKDFGGDLRVRNHPDGGAVFSIMLKAARARATSELEAQA